MDREAENNPLETRNKPSLFVQWADGSSCVIGVADGNGGLAVMLNPLEVESLIQHLSRGRLMSLGVTVH